MNQNIHQQKGMFITFEGVHGCGKSTIINLVQDKLIGLGLEVVITNDLSGTSLGEEIRKVNLESGFQVAPMTETLLFAAAKHQNLIEVIKPNLELGKIVICERFVDAFFVFQGFARGLSTELLEDIHYAATEGIMPDFTVLLDIDPFHALSRIESSKKHRLENESKEYHMKLRQGYIERAKNYPERIKAYNADLDKEIVFNDVWSDLSQILHKKYRNSA